MNSRRNFIRTSGITAVASFSGIETLFAAMEKRSGSLSGKGLKFSFIPYDLQLRHTFTLANSSRTHTPDVLTKLEFEGQGNLVFKRADGSTPTGSGTHRQARYLRFGADGLKLFNRDNNEISYSIPAIR